MYFHNYLDNKEKIASLNNLKNEQPKKKTRVSS